MRVLPIALALLLAAPLTPTRAQQASPPPADPYAALADYDFGKDSSILRAIEGDVRARGTAGYPEIERRLLEAAEKPGASHATKKFVAETLCIVGSPRCIPAARKLLQDPKTAHLGCIVLGRLPFKEAEAALVEELSKAAGPARIQILNTLAGSRNPALTALLAKWIADPDADLARASLAALGKAGCPNATKILADAKPAAPLARARDEALVVAADRLATDGRTEDARAIFQRLHAAKPDPTIAVAALRGLVETDQANALKLVLESLKDPRLPVALAAARLSLLIPDNKATVALAAAFPDTAPAVQVALLRALADRKDPSARAIVAQSLASPSEEVQAQAALACETLGDQSVLKPLVDLAKGEGTAAIAARTALSRIPIPQADKALLAMLDGGDEKTLTLATELLIARDAKPAKAKFFAMGQSADAATRKVAYTGMEAFAGPEDMPAILKTIAATKDSADQKRLARVLWGATRAIGTDDARFEALWAKVGPLDATTQKVVLPTAAEAGGEKSLAIVRALMKSGDKDLADAATRTLFAWANTSAAPAILETIQSSPNPTYKTLGARAMVRLAGTLKKGDAKRGAKLLQDTLALLEREEDKAMVQAAIKKLSGK